MFIFDKHKLSFYISTALWFRKYDGVIFHVTTQLKCHVTFWVGPYHPDLAPYQVLGTMDLVNVEIKRFDLTRDHVIDVSRDFAGEVLPS